MNLSISPPANYFAAESYNCYILRFLQTVYMGTRWDEVFILRPSQIYIPVSVIFFIAGEAEAILARSQATSKGIAIVSETLKQYGGLEVRFPSLYF